MLDETRKGHDIRLLIEGRTDVYRPPAKIYKERSEFMKKAQDELQAGVLTVDEFLQRLTSRYNKTSTNLANSEEGNVSDGDGEENYHDMQTLMERIIELNSK